MPPSKAPKIQIKDLLGSIFFSITAGGSMKLNTYVGLRAIAWIVTDGAKVVQHGIKRVNISFDNYYEFISGNPVTKRINRRMKAGARRNLWRFKSRRNNLKNILSKNGYFTDKKYSDKKSII